MNQKFYIMLFVFCVKVINCTNPIETGEKKKIRKNIFKSTSNFNLREKINYKKRYKKTTKGTDHETSPDEKEDLHYEPEIEELEKFKDLNLRNFERPDFSRVTEQDQTNEDFTFPQIKSSKFLENKGKKAKKKSRYKYQEKYFLPQNPSVFDLPNSLISETSSENDETLNAREYKKQFFDKPYTDRFGIKSAEACGSDFLTNSYQHDDIQSKSIQTDEYLLSKSTQTDEILYTSERPIKKSYDQTQNSNFVNENIGYTQYPIQNWYAPQQPNLMPNYSTPVYPNTSHFQGIEQSGYQASNFANLYPNPQIENYNPYTQNNPLNEIHSLENAGMCEVVIDPDFYIKNKIKKIILSKSFESPEEFHDIPNENFEFYTLTFEDVSIFYDISVDYNPEVVIFDDLRIDDKKKKKIFTTDITYFFFFDTTKNILENLEIKAEKRKFEEVSKILSKNIKFFDHLKTLPVLYSGIFISSPESQKFLFSEDFLIHKTMYFSLFPTPFHISKKIESKDLRYSNLYEKLESARLECVIILKELEKINDLIETQNSDRIDVIETSLWFMRGVLKTGSFYLPDIFLNDQYILYILSLYKILYEEVNSYRENTENFYKSLSEMQDGKGCKLNEELIHKSKFHNKSNV